MAATLDVARAGIQDGSIYDDPPSTAGFDEFGTALGSKGGGISSLTELVASAWNSTVSNLSTALSVTSTQVKVIELEAKSQGREPTEEELDEACGPLSFLTKLPNILDDALADIFGKFDEFASAIGETVGEFMGKLDALIADVAEAVDEIAEAAAQLVLDAFEAANAVALEAIEAIESAVNAVTGAINDAIQFATDAFNSAVDKLLAFADTLNFASLFSLDCQEEALDAAVDKEKIADADEVQRVIAPEVVATTDETVTSETLPVPQTTFETAATPIPRAEIDSFIGSYRITARDLRDAKARTTPRARRGEIDFLERVNENTLQELRIVALSAGVDINTLAIYGRNFDQTLAARDKPTGQDAAKPKTETTGQSAQKEIDSIKADIARYNRLNQEQIREINRQKISIFRSGPEFAAEVQATDRKTSEVKVLGSAINLRIAKASPEVKKGVGISRVDAVKTGLFN
jgi:hypothetical protein